MTIQECYEKMGGDYNDVMSRLRTDERVKKFLLKVADDKSFELLGEMLKVQNIEEAFRAAHTLKGVSSNLSIMRLYESACAMTEALRGKTDYDPSFEALYERVKADHELTVDCIRNVD